MQYINHTFDGVAVPSLKQAAQYGPDPLNDRLSPVEHTKLVRHILQRLVQNEPHRARRVRRMIAAEIDLLGIVKPTGSDCERRENRESGNSASVPDAIYPFGWVDMQKLAAEICKVVFPSEAPYAVVASAEKRELSQTLMRAFRAQGVRFDHRNNVQAAIFDTVALDCGALEFKWDIARASGSVSTDALTNKIAIGDDHAGVRLRQLNPYNISWDDSVELPDLASEGEFVAIFDRYNPFRVHRENNVKNYLTQEALEYVRQVEAAVIGTVDETLLYSDAGATMQHGANWFYYEPDIATDRAEILKAWGNGHENGIQRSFTGLFEPSTVKETNNESIHFTKIYIRLQPSKWGLGKRRSKAEQARDPFQVWEIHLYGPGYIGYAAPIESQLDMFPVAIATMNFRRREGRSMRLGEQAAQIGLLSSTILNMHKRTMRKGLEGGLTIFNPSIVDLNNVPETSGGRVPTKGHAYDLDLRTAVMQLNDLPDVKNSLSDVERIAAMTSNLFPTNSNPAMAGLDRATTYQAQAVMATSMTSLIYYASFVDGQLMVPARLHMHRLNLLHPSDLTYLDEAQQSLVRLNSDDIANVEFELVQSQPLMGIDRIRAETVMRDVLNILFQSGGQLSPVQEMMLDHYVRTAGLVIDMDAYKKAAMEEVQAYQARQQAEVANEQAQAQKAAASGGPRPLGPATQ